MPPLTVAPKIVRNLRLTGAALTENPSQAGASILLIRKKEAPLAENVEVDLQNKRVTELEAQLTLERTARAADAEKLAELGRKETERAERELKRADAESKAQCIEITRTAFPSVKAQGIETGDVLYRVRKAAAASGDTALETDLLALLRSAQGFAEASKLIRSSLGNGATEEEVADGVDPEVMRAIKPFMADAKNNVRVAITRACAKAAKDNDMATYSLLSNVKVSQ